MIDVSKLSKVELNRAMIWCYPDCIYGRSKGTIYSRYSSFIGFVDVGFLDVWDLTMPLAVENKLCIDTEGFWGKDFEDFLGVAEVCTEDGQHEQYGDPLRAICEVLVMIKWRASDG